MDCYNNSKSKFVSVAPLRRLQDQFEPITKAVMISIHYVENRVGEVVHRYDIGTVEVVVESCHCVRSMTSGAGRMTGLVSSRLTFSASRIRRWRSLTCF